MPNIHSFVLIEVFALEKQMWKGMWMAAFTFSLIHQFLAEYGGLSFHNIPWSATVQLPMRAPNQPWGSTCSYVSWVSCHSPAQHAAEPKSPAFLHSNQVLEQSKLLPSRYVTSKLQWDHTRNCNPITNGSHQPTHLWERSTQTSCLVLLPTLWKKDAQTITPHNSSSAIRRQELMLPVFPPAHSRVQEETLTQL